MLLSDFFKVAFWVLSEGSGIYVTSSSPMRLVKLTTPPDSFYADKFYLKLLRLIPLFSISLKLGDSALLADVYPDFLTGLMLIYLESLSTSNLGLASVALVFFYSSTYSSFSYLNLPDKLTPVRSSLCIDLAYFLLFLTCSLLCTLSLYLFMSLFSRSLTSLCCF